MYQITMTIDGKTITGATYGNFHDLSKELDHLRMVAHKNNFPAKYSYINTNADLILYRVITIKNGEYIRMQVAAHSAEEVREIMAKLGCKEVRTNPLCRIKK